MTWAERCGNSTHSLGCNCQATGPRPAQLGRIPKAALELKATLVSKNGDYAPTTEFSNFEESAKFAGVQPFEVMLAQVAIKYTRIQSLHHNADAPNNESLRDSLVDLAGYAVIAAAWLDEVQGEGS